MTEMTVGVIGLGKVGIGIAETLHESGCEVVGYDISEVARERAADTGIDIAVDNSDVAARTNLVFLSLPTSDASCEVVSTVSTAADAGTVIFDMSTLSPTTAVELHDLAAEREVHYHDSPVTGGAVGAKQGKLTMMVGGDADRIRTHEEVFATLADAVYHIGDVGDAQFVKLIHNQIGQTVLLIFVEGLFFAEDWGIDPAVLYRTLRHYTQIYDDKLDSFFGNQFPDDFVERFVPADEEVLLGPDQQFNLAEAHKDLMELISLADEHQVHYPMGSFTEQQHRLAINAGYGDQPHPNVLDLYQNLFDVDVSSDPPHREKSEGRIV
jgi:3-hydroxyisobutyrate dehydrogenase-like beta-hydroxyacid dehydrogenase